MGENSESVRFSDVVQDPNAGRILEFFDSLRNVQRPYERVYFLFILGDGENVGAASVDGAPFRVGAAADKLL